MKGAGLAFGGVPMYPSSSCLFWRVPFRRPLDQPWVGGGGGWGSQSHPGGARLGHMVSAGCGQAPPSGAGTPNHPSPARAPPHGPVPAGPWERGGLMLRSAPLPAAVTAVRPAGPDARRAVRSVRGRHGRAAVRALRRRLPLALPLPRRRPARVSATARGWGAPIGSARVPPAPTTPGRARAARSLSSASRRAVLRCRSCSGDPGPPPGEAAPAPSPARPAPAQVGAPLGVGRAPRG